MLHGPRRAAYRDTSKCMGALREAVRSRIEQSNVRATNDHPGLINFCICGQLQRNINDTGDELIIEPEENQQFFKEGPIGSGQILTEPVVPIILTTCMMSCMVIVNTAGCTTNSLTGNCSFPRESQ